MKIGFFPRYDRLGASSRHRFFNYFERWQKGMDESCQLAIYPGLSDCYLQKLYHNGKVGKLTQAWELAKLFKRACLIRCDAMVIEYELMIGLPYKYEAALIGKRPYILNFDDNVWTKYSDMKMKSIRCCPMCLV